MRIADVFTFRNGKAIQMPAFADRGLRSTDLAQSLMPHQTADQSAQ